MWWAKMCSLLYANKLFYKQVGQPLPEKLRADIETGRKHLSKGSLAFSEKSQSLLGLSWQRGPEEGCQWQFWATLCPCPFSSGELTLPCTYGSLSANPGCLSFKTNLKESGNCLIIKDIPSDLILVTILNLKSQLYVYPCIWLAFQV